MTRTCVRPGRESMVPLCADGVVRAVAQLVKAAIDDLSTDACAAIAKSYSTSGQFGVECFFDPAGKPSLRLLTVGANGERNVLVEIRATRRPAD